MSATFTDWLRFQSYAKNNGHDSIEFVAMFPSGPRNCKWLDAYFGFITVDGMEGFLTVDVLDEIAPGALCMVTNGETK